MMLAEVMSSGRIMPADGSTSVQDYTINLSDVDDGAMSDTNGTANTITENVANGTAVGITANANDTDGSDSVTYTLSDDANGRFAIDGGSGVVTVVDHYRVQGRFQRPIGRLLAASTKMKANRLPEVAGFSRPGSWFENEI